MLVLTRHANQKIVIGEDITITVLEVRGDQVRIGIDAPREIRVHREEIADALRRQAEQQAEAEDEPEATPPDA